MSDQQDFSLHVAGLRQIKDWCHKAQGLVGRLLVDPHVSHRWGMRLTECRAALSQLAGEAESQLRVAGAGLYDAVTTASLLVRARQASGELARYLEEMGIPWREHENLEAEQKVPIGQHRLPPLPYPYDALEPHIDEATMRVHHDKHHQTYVNGLNKAEQMMAKARESGDFDLIKHWEGEAAFHGAGHYLHTIFWNNMTPSGGGSPPDGLADALTADFGSVDHFKKHFSAAAERVEGVGWAILVWAPRARHLEILQAEKHQNLSQWDVVPLLTLDVWEHAYYLKHQNDRRSYIRDWWNVVNWPNVAKRHERARTLRWEPF